jgi:hypothetical protein
MSENVKKTKETRINGRFAKGNQEGNRKGRPKKENCIPDMLRKILNEQDVFDANKRTNLENICRKAVNQALGGDRDARNFIADRTEGRAVERVLTQEIHDEIIIE